MPSVLLYLFDCISTDTIVLFQVSLPAFNPWFRFHCFKFELVLSWIFTLLCRVMSDWSNFSKDCPKYFSESQNLHAITGLLKSRLLCLDTFSIHDTYMLLCLFIPQNIIYFTIYMHINYHKYDTCVVVCPKNKMLIIYFIFQEKKKMVLNTIS